MGDIATVLKMALRFDSRRIQCQIANLERQSLLPIHDMEEMHAAEWVDSCLEYARGEYDELMARIAAIREALDDG